MLPDASWTGLAFRKFVDRLFHLLPELLMRLITASRIQQQRTGLEAVPRGLSCRSRVIACGRLDRQWLQKDREDARINETGGNTWFFKWMGSHEFALNLSTYESMWVYLLQGLSR